MGMAPPDERSLATKIVTWQTSADQPRQFSGWLSIYDAKKKVQELELSAQKLNLDMAGEPKVLRIMEQDEI